VLRTQRKLSCYWLAFLWGFFIFISHYDL